MSACLPKTTPSPAAFFHARMVAVRASGEEAAARCGGEGDEGQDGRFVSRESLDAFVRLRGIVDLDGFVHRPRRDASVG